MRFYLFVATLIFSASAFGASVYKAEYNTLDLDTHPMIVTNVTFSGLTTSNDVISLIASHGGGGGGGSLTTNDVCTIVTNVVPWWTFSPPSIKIEGELRQIYVERDDIDGTWYVYGGEEYPLGAVLIPGESSVFRSISDDGEIEITATWSPRNALGLARLEDVPSTNGLLRADAISTNNAAFVTAVTNCPVVIASADAEALAEWGIYGSGGTIGALLAALAAAVATLKKNKMPLYQMVDVSPGGDGVTTVVPPFCVATMGNVSAGQEITVAVGALQQGVHGVARDAVLVIDCTSLMDGDQPTVTWGANFHPRTDAGADFACEAGVRNVYYISEYAAGEFTVGGWVETEGGNAQSGGSGE